MIPMKRLILNTVAAALIAGAGVGVFRAQPAFAQAPAAGSADVVLTNGKIITVDNQFKIAQAIAIKGDRFIAVGTNQEINRLAGPNTKKIDLGGKSVIPGLIDHHAHLLRAAETWSIEVRLDDVDSRKQALDMVRAKATALGAGQWVYNSRGAVPS
jgi:predicted amidohydrolase YtcJ